MSRYINSLAARKFQAAGIGGLIESRQVVLPQDDGRSPIFTFTYLLREKVSGRMFRWKQSSYAQPFIYLGSDTGSDKADIWPFQALLPMGPTGLL